MAYERYYLGLDMGTSSLGWAVTNEKYQLLRRKGKDLWGVRLFSEANTAADRRSHRTARRRLQREKARVGYLRELFAEEINKIDPGFYQRLADSKYHREDKESNQPFALFADTGYTDKEYYHDYPTIFHLRKALLDLNNTGKEYDVRLVYLAILNMFKHRGHFLNANLDEKSGSDLHKSVEQLNISMLDILGKRLEEVEQEKLENILSSKNYSNTARLEKLIELFQLSKSKNKQEVEILKLICGLKGTLSKIFENGDFNEDTVKMSISFRDANYEESITEVESILAEDEFEMLLIAKQIHDWAVLANIMSGEEYLSVARVKAYDKHKKDLEVLKRVLKSNSMDSYKKMFRIMEDNNYSAYVGSVNYKNEKVRRGAKHDTDEIFKKMKAIVSGCEDCEEKNYILCELDKGTFLPKQVTSSNGVIPNQVHKKELKRIIENAQKYLEFLTYKDESGLSVGEKIIKLFEFQIPYYVGPLSYKVGENEKMGKRGNMWSVRKESGAVLPWNFEQKIDIKKSAEKFINNLTNHCTYLNGETVLPKNSLLYEKYMVLNELNKLKINGEGISVELKQNIYNDLFKKGKRVTSKMLVKYLKDIGEVDANDNPEISGIDGDFTNRLANHKKFFEIFGKDNLTQEQINIAEDVIFYSTVYGDSRKFLSEKIREKYQNILDESQIKRILGMKFKDWGRFSRQLLELNGTDKQTGEVSSIISKMWNENYNFMELMAEDKFTYSEEIEQRVKKIEKTLSTMEYSDLDELYISAPVKRMVWQTILVLKELEKVMGYGPDKIFVEMAKGPGEKNQRKDSRKKKFLDLYKQCQKESRNWKSELEATEESKFKSKKLYLYYTQKGKCMYSGENIELTDLFNDNLYDIDHIYPRHFIKDDSIENNLVLVKKTHNAHKSDTFPIEESIRRNMHSIWKMLRDGNFITEEKYKRLMRNNEFTDKEQAEFISRQIVETRQGTKVITDLFEKTFPQSEVIYVKAGLVSDFRHKYGFLKCRNINDFHHADDAYLNIVVGNVYNTKFTKHPINFIKDYKRDPEKYKYHMDKLFEYPVSRGEENAWITKGGESFKMVRKMMAKNTPLVTRMNYEEHGGIADQTIYSAKEASKVNGDGYISVKSSDEKISDTCKYGGMKKYKGTYFVLVEHTEKGKRVRTLEDIPLYLKEQLDSREKLQQYFKKEKRFRYENPVVIYNRIKRHSLIKVNGFYLYLTGRTGKQLRVLNAVQLSLDAKMARYVKWITKVNDEYQSEAQYDEDEKITREKNLELYEVLKDKHMNKIYSKRPNAVGSKLNGGTEKFSDLPLSRQVYVLLQIIQLSQLINEGVDLREIGGSKASGTCKISKKISGNDEFKLINQSVTGLFENEIDLLTV